MYLVMVTQIISFNVEIMTVVSIVQVSFNITHLKSLILSKYFKCQRVLWNVCSIQLEILEFHECLWYNFWKKKDLF